jgi:peptide/nickel transport system ATP-binding protein
MSEPVLSVERLATRLEGSAGAVHAVDGVDLRIERGETFAIVGESGCGKSMTALSILRLLPETGTIVAGSVGIGGTDLLSLPEAAMRNVRGRRIAMIFQEPATSLNPVLTVQRQIAEVLERHTMLRGAAVRSRAIELLDAVGIPDAVRRIDDYSFQLSGGMKQRVMIALALAGEPDLLIADEPTTALDVTIQAQVLALLRDVQRRNGMAILLITHDLGIVAQMAHRVAVMYCGRFVEVAPRERFFRAPQHPYTRKLFDALPGAGKRGTELAVMRGQVPALDGKLVGCAFADRCDFVMARCREETPGWTRMGGETGGAEPGRAEHQVRCFLRETGHAGLLPAAAGSPVAVADRPAMPAQLQTPPPALLGVRTLKMHFPIRRGVLQRTVGWVKAVDGVSLELKAGRTLALVGESGCGKTTVGKAILQLMRPTAGEVVFDGVELTRLRGAAMRQRRRDFQIIFQDPYASLNPRMRIADILAEGMAALGTEPDAASISRRADELLEHVGLSPSVRDRYPHEFSGGQRQRIAIARALAVRPRLIVCDEPTSALDVSVQAQILNLLKGLQREFGLSYLFITHNIAVVEYLAHDVAVMYLGRIVERGTADEILGAPKHPYTQALLASVPRVDTAWGAEFPHLEGELPSPANPPAGCHFHPRCPNMTEICRREYPQAVRLSATSEVSCVLYPDGANLR